MNNTILLKVLSGTAFTISAIFTIMLMLSGTVGFVPALLAVAMALILEFAKCFFFYKSFNSSHLPLIVRGVVLALSVLLFCSSIVASVSFVYNQSNETRNKSIKSSKEYKEQEQRLQRQGEVFNQKVNEITQLKKQAQELPANYYTMKAQIMDKVAVKTKELEQITQDMNTPKEIKYNMTETKGYTAFLKVIADKLNQTEEGKENPWSVEQLELILFSMLSVTFEVVAIFLFYIQQIEKQESLSGTIRDDAESPQKTPQNHNKIRTFRPKEVIGFKKPVTDFKQEDLQRYIEYMYSTAKGNVSQGYRTIGQAISIDVETARKIKGALEQRGIISTVGNRTILVKDKQEVFT